MKVSTYNETVEIVRARNAGRLKEFLASKCMGYHTAVMRVIRFRREYPAEYRRLTKMLTFVTCEKRRHAVN